MKQPKNKKIPSKGRKAKLPLDQTTPPEDFNSRLEAAKALRAQDLHHPSIMPTPEPELIMSDDRSARIESVLDTEQAASLRLTFKQKGAGMYASLQDMQADIAQMSIMPGPQLRELLIKQSEWAALQAIKACNDILKLIHDPGTSEAAKEVLIARLPKFAIFTQAVNRQRMEILKAGFIDAAPPKQDVDPADMPLDDWEKSFGMSLMLPAGSAKQ